MSRRAEADSKASREDDSFFHLSKKVLDITLMFVDEGTFAIEMIADANGPIAANNDFIIVQTQMRKFLFRNAWSVPTNGNQ